MVNEKIVSGKGISSWTQHIDEFSFPRIPVANKQKIKMRYEASKNKGGII